MKNLSPALVLNFSFALVLNTVVLFSPLLFLGGCGGNALSSLTNPPPVSAQQAYSNSSLAGTYSFVHNGTDGNGQAFNGTGAVQFDGAGNMTGAYTDYYRGGLTCQYSVSGTYSLSTSASGTANLTATTTSNGCSGTTGTIAIQAAQQGQSVLFAQNDGVSLDSGIAVKQ